MVGYLPYGELIKLRAANKDFKRFIESTVVKH